MSNPNFVTIYGPDGEAYEMSRANARDLAEHTEGWSFQKPKVIVVEKKAEEPEQKAEETPEVVEEPEVEETAEEETTEEVTEEPAAEETEEVTILKTTEDFDGMTEREDVVAYLAKAFPDFKPHHLAKRDKLVEQAVELANA